MEKNEFLIKTNTQLTYKDLKIGVGNFRDEKCEENSVSREKCPSVSLWISYRDRSDLESQIRVKLGDKVDIGVYSLEITEISINSTSNYIKIAISE